MNILHDSTPTAEIILAVNFLHKCIALPSMGALLGGPYSTLLTCGTEVENMDTHLEHKETSTPGDLIKGFSSEASQIGAAGQNPFHIEHKESSALGDSDKVPAQRLHRWGRLKGALLSNEQVRLL
jgi:hypothetical protein